MKKTCYVGTNEGSPVLLIELYAPSIEKREGSETYYKYKYNNNNNNMIVYVIK